MEGDIGVCVSLGAPHKTLETHKWMTDLNHEPMKTLESHMWRTYLKHSPSKTLNDYEWRIDFHDCCNTFIYTSQQHSHNKEYTHHTKNFIVLRIRQLLTSCHIWQAITHDIQPNWTILCFVLKWNVQFTNHWTAVVVWFQCTFWTAHVKLHILLQSTFANVAASSSMMSLGQTMSFSGVFPIFLVQINLDDPLRTLVHPIW